MITEMNNWVAVGGRLDGWVDGSMSVSLFMVGLIGSMPPLPQPT